MFFIRHMFGLTFETKQDKAKDNSYHWQQDFLERKLRVDHLSSKIIDIGIEMQEGYTSL